MNLKVGNAMIEQLILCGPSRRALHIPNPGMTKPDGPLFLQSVCTSCGREILSTETDPGGEPLDHPLHDLLMNRFWLAEVTPFLVIEEP